MHLVACHSIHPLGEKSLDHGNLCRESAHPLKCMSRQKFDKEVLLVVLKPNSSHLLAPKATFVLLSTTRRCMYINLSLFYENFPQQARKQLHIKTLSHSLFKHHSQYAFNIRKVGLQHKTSPYRLPATLKVDPSITFQGWGLKDFIHFQDHCSV